MRLRYTTTNRTQKLSMRTGSVLLLLFLSALLLSCTSGNKPPDTPTSGKISISVDETFSPVMDSQVYTFNHLYPNAQIRMRNMSEEEAFTDLLMDSARLIVTSRKLNDKEKAYFNTLKFTPAEVKIATDAIAFIVHPENKDTLLRYNQLLNIFDGEIREWKQLNPKSALDSIRIVFDHSSSGTARYVKEKLTRNHTLSANCYAVKTNRDVITYVTQHKNALGVIGVNWISDGDDPKSLGFLSQIKVVAIAPPDTSQGAGDYYQPYQAYVAQGFYPFCRDIYLISREARTGLGTGFASFVAGDKGQRIILKSGLVPATMPVRIVSIRNN